MKFDPTKPFSHVHGIDPAYPGAKYQQGNFVFNAQHAIVGGSDPDKGISEAQKAKRDLVEKLTAELEVITNDLEKAQSNFNKSQTTQTKSALTKAKNKYEAAREELAEIAG